MNCLSDEVIQMYIDGELPGEEQIRVDTHLQRCKKCTERVESQREVVLGFKASINSLVDDSIEIPAFIQTNRRRGLSKKKLYKIIYPLAAASILILFLALPFNRNTEDPIEIIVISSFSGEIDANLPISDQEIEISFYNENGTKIE